MPPAVTASTGLDALTQLIEPFVSSRANPLTDALCRDGLVRVARSLRRAYEHGEDQPARHDMALAALFSGLALGNAGLGSVHGFAGVIGGMVPAPHGALCAALLPHAIRVNVRAFRERSPDSQALARFAELGQLLTGSVSAAAAEAVCWIDELCTALHVPPLGAYGLERRHLPELLEKSAAASSMKANPIALTRVEMEEIVLAALGPRRGFLAKKCPMRVEGYPAAPGVNRAEAVRDSGRSLHRHLTRLRGLHSQARVLLGRLADGLVQLPAGAGGVLAGLRQRSTGPSVALLLDYPVVGTCPTCLAMLRRVRALGSRGVCLVDGSEGVARLAHRRGADGAALQPVSGFQAGPGRDHLQPLLPPVWHVVCLTRADGRFGALPISTGDPPPDRVASGGSRASSPSSTPPGWS